MKILKKTALFGLGLAFLSFMSCQQQSKDAGTDEEMVETAAVEEAPAAPEINDAQIAHIVVTANQIDVDYGKVALEKSSNETVRKFAQTMIDDHTNIINSASELAGRLGVTPEDNATSQSLMDGAKTENEKVADLEGEAYDKAYIDNEVDYHRAVIDAVKNTLIPNTQNEELKQALIDVTPLLEHHLQMAEQAQAEMGS